MNLFWIKNLPKKVISKNYTINLLRKKLQLKKYKYKNHFKYKH